MASLLDWLEKLTHVGVDRTLPRHETKHVVLANQFALFFSAIHFLVALNPGTGVWPPIVREAHYAGAALTPLVLVLNATKHPTIASAWLLGLTNVVFFLIGRVEPEGAELAMSFIVNALAAWFVFPSWRRSASWVATIGSFATMSVLVWLLRRFPPAGPTGFDVPYFGAANRSMFFAIIVGIGIYAARAMARAEKELVAEREKTERILKREVSHQVAERSRELGEAFARIEAPLAAPALEPGDRFQTRYRIEAPIGEGGMGAVYEVERISDKTRLALKVVTGQVSAQAASRFAREAEIGARVHHDNLVSIVDVGVAEGGAPFLVMELVRGTSLEAERARFGDVAWGLPILRQIAEGLVALHDAGVVHRDLKPANVLLSGASAKISDFGISRLGGDGALDVEGATLSATTPKRRDLTGTGMLLGTPIYMAPEAARGGRNLDTAADVFAFGIIAYEVLTARSPFSAPPVLVALAGQSITEPAEIEAHVTDSIRGAIRACLSTDPSARPAARHILDKLR